MSLRRPMFFRPACPACTLTQAQVCSSGKQSLGSIWRLLATSWYRSRRTLGPVPAASVAHRSCREHRRHAGARRQAMTSWFDFNNTLRKVIRLARIVRNCAIMRMKPLVAHVDETAFVDWSTIPPSSLSFAEMLILGGQESLSGLRRLAVGIEAKGYRLSS